MKITKISVLKLLLTMITVASLAACDFFDSTPKCASQEIQNTLESLISKDFKNKISNKNIGTLISNSPDKSIQFLAGGLETHSGIFKTSSNIKISFDNFLTNDKAEGKKRSCTTLVTYKIENFEVKFENSNEAGNFNMSSIGKFSVLSALAVNADLTQSFNLYHDLGTAMVKLQSDPSYVNEMNKKLNNKLVSLIPTKAKIDYTVQKTDSGKEFYVSILSISATQ